MITAIYIAAETNGEQEAKEEIQLVASKGIIGDRNFDQSQWPGQNLTLIEQEEIDRYNRTHDQSIEPNATRRNIITQGIRLNALVGKHFKIGDVELYGVELCEPCRSLGGNLANDTITSAEAIKAFVHKGGLRADILSDGVIAVGMEVRTAD